MQLLNFSMKKSAVLSPAEYVQLYNENTDSIDSVRIILPRLGADNHFGMFKVVYSPKCFDVINNGKFSA